MNTTEVYRRRRRMVLFLGLVLTGLGFSQFSDIWVSKNGLQKISGTLRNARTNISWTFTESAKNPTQISKSHKSELIFQLNGHNQEYYLIENVGEHAVDEKYEAILKGLKNADTISVWIKKSDARVWRPVIFQIDSDQKTLLNFSHLHIENKLLAVLSLIVGIFTIIFYMLILLREKRASTALHNKK